MGTTWKNWSWISCGTEVIRPLNCISVIFIYSILGNNDGFELSKLANCILLKLFVGIPYDPSVLNTIEPVLELVHKLLVQLLFDGQVFVSTEQSLADIQIPVLVQ